ncbi:MAG: DUF4428 domain-containing protein [Oscillospiraceae bacterium]|nr:DUF4428 domain-containing protein [Oscillospiraceae bacterium]
MGLFDKKFCAVCGEKIGIIATRKLEDGGHLCKDCAKKLSPWFSDRRNSTAAEIKAQLEYREANKEAVAAFRPTRTLGRFTKLILDEDARKFVVTDASNLLEANPDVLDFSQVTGCDLDVRENRRELKRTGQDGKQISYIPPRYEYSYDFYVTIHVNTPYFDEMNYKLNAASVSTGEQAMNAAPGGWRVQRTGILSGVRTNDYYEYLNLGNEIKDTLTQMRQEIRRDAEEAKAPRQAVTCPWCGATTTGDASGCCEYCGGSLNG